MQPKCNYCEFFGEKCHCNNCKLFNQTRTTRPPEEISCSLEELVEYIAGNNDISERLIVGDYKTIELYAGEKVKMTLVGVEHDILEDGSIAKATFAVTGLDGRYRLNTPQYRSGDYSTSKMNLVKTEQIFLLLPPVLRASIKVARKKALVQNDSSKSILAKLWLFSESEVKGVINYSYGDEGEQYEYFSENNRENLKKLGASWLRSAAYTSYGSFCYLMNGSVSHMSGEADNLPIVFGFCI